jgi:hypothetical protein
MLACIKFEATRLSVMGHLADVANLPNVRFARLFNKSIGFRIPETSPVLRARRREGTASFPFVEALSSLATIAALKIDFREIFSVVRSSTFATVSG